VSQSSKVGSFDSAPPPKKWPETSQSSKVGSFDIPKPPYATRNPPKKARQRTYEALHRERGRASIDGTPRTGSVAICLVRCINQTVMIKKHLNCCRLGLGSRRKIDSGRCPPRPGITPSRPRPPSTWVVVDGGHRGPDGYELGPCLRILKHIVWVTVSIP
jgi:hypothetical protein